MHFRSNVMYLKINLWFISLCDTYSWSSMRIICPVVSTGYYNFDKLNYEAPFSPVWQDSPLIWTVRKKRTWLHPFQANLITEGRLFSMDTLMVVSRDAVVRKMGVMSLSVSEKIGIFFWYRYRSYHLLSPTRNTADNPQMSALDSYKYLTPCAFCRHTKLLNLRLIKSYDDKIPILIKIDLSFPSVYGNQTFR